MKKRTSIHKITADQGLSHFGKIYWLFINLVNNVFSNRFVDKRLIESNFRVSNFKKYSKYINKYSSPSRKMCDLFWASLPWSKIKESLGEINIVDIGCGKGGYGEKIVKFSDDRINSYKGVDLSESEKWKNIHDKDSRLSFEVFDGENIYNKIGEKTNFIQSQSAMEHIENDLDFFRQIKDYIDNLGKEVIQVHLFPAKASIWLYLWHGRRQYTKRSVSKISKLFSKDSKCYLYKLGNVNGNKFHFKNITLTKILKRDDLRKVNPDKYVADSTSAIIDDMKMEKNNHPVFYALVIHSNFKKEIF
jgi:SAM-dependent methyltransferase